MTTMTSIGPLAVVLLIVSTVSCSTPVCPVKVTFDASAYNTMYIPYRQQGRQLSAPAAMWYGKSTPADCARALGTNPNVRFGTALITNGKITRCLGYPAYEKYDTPVKSARNETTVYLFLNRPAECPSMSCELRRISTPANKYGHRVLLKTKLPICKHSLKHLRVSSMPKNASATGMRPIDSVILIENSNILYMINGITEQVTVKTGNAYASYENAIKPISKFYTVNGADPDKFPAMPMTEDTHLFMKTEPSFKFYNKDGRFGLTYNGDGCPLEITMHRITKEVIITVPEMPYKDLNGYCVE